MTPFIYFVHELLEKYLGKTDADEMRKAAMARKND
jgi:hypothetical protein